jgi:galactokinase
MGMNGSIRGAEVAEARREFADRFGAEPTHLAWAPGRVNLIGEHTDYNSGFVLPMATEAGLLLAARPRSDRTVRVASRTMGESFELSLDAPITRDPPRWSLYLRGVLAGLLAGGVALPGFDAVITGNLPPGSGLSSSAALEVGTATLGEALAQTALEPLEKALLCQRAEHEFAGVPCGIMDQFAVVFSEAGHALLLDCRSLRRELVALASGDVSVLVINSMVRHELAGGEYAVRRRQCQEAATLLGVESLRDVTPLEVRSARDRLPEVLFRRALHVATENDRTLAAAAAIRRGDWPGLGQLLYASHESLQRDYEVSCAELDLIVSLAQSIGQPGGVFGCRMTGGGFGGCAVALVRTAELDRITALVAERYQQQTGTLPETLATRPAGGAVVVQAPASGAAPDRRTHPCP